jgi:hypothetical protein
MRLLTAAELYRNAIRLQAGRQKTPRSLVPAQYYRKNRAAKFRKFPVWLRIIS